MIRSRLRLPIFIVVIAGAASAAVVRGQTGAVNGEWRSYGGDSGHIRYAPLSQIDATNFSTLTVAWRFKTDHLGPRPEFNFQSTPLMANGALYTTAGTRRAVAALDPETGEELWIHSEHEGPRGAVAPRRLSGRGLAYRTDGKEERILYVTPGYRLVALNAKTGMRVPTFGEDGIVDLKQNIDQEIDPMSGEIGLHATPTVAGNVVVVGAAHRWDGVPTGKSNVKGHIRGFDVRTGRRLWIFRGERTPAQGANAGQAGAAGGEGTGAAAGVNVQGLPLMKPPYGQLTAIDLAKGEILWQVAHGETPDEIRNHPALNGMNIPRTGRPGVVGSLTTKTLVISGEAGFGPTPNGARGAMLRAYGKATGKEVGAVYLPAPQTGSPMTYMMNGRQYLVVAVSGAGYSGELIAFRVPS